MERGETVPAPAEDAGTVHLGKIALEQKLITPEQLREALAEQSRELAAGRPQPRALGNILVERGHLSPTQLTALLQAQRATAVKAAERPGPQTMGKYQLRRILGRGGMGIVYEAVDGALGRTVALKTMLPNPNATPQEAAQDEERFLREARLSANLAKHPHIVSVYEAGIIGGRRYLAMEYIDGQSMSKWRKQGSITIRQQVSCLRDVAVAVHHAHKQGVIHRDLKPDNILVDAEGQPHVTDFGLAKMVGQNVKVSLTAAGMVMGTPAYMSPEQAQGLKSIDGRTDIYSLGVMLYEVLTGRQPFTGETAIEILMKAANTAAVKPSASIKPGASPAIDTAIENICLKAMARQPQDRYASAEALAGDLSRWLAGEAVHVVVPTAGKVQKTQGRKTRVLLGAAALVALAAGGIFAWRAQRGHLGPLEDARMHFESKMYRQALELYEDVLRTDPDNTEAQTGRDAAKANLALLETEKKLASAIKVEKKDPDGTLSGNPSPALPAEEAWARGVDLLALVDPERDNVSGAWTLSDRKLLSDKLGRSRIEIPYHPPDEYDLRVDFTRQSGTGPVFLILSHLGRSFEWVMGAASNTVYGFESVRGASAAGNPTTARVASALENGKPVTTIVQVRKDGLRAYVAGKLVSHWKTDYSDLAPYVTWKLRDPGLLGLGTQGSPTAFEKVSLLEVSGKGSPEPFAARPLLNAQRVDPKALRPGLIAEYYAGTNFEVPLLRRIDPAINFRWGDGPPWPGGPCDWFSCRWSGYLAVSRPGEIALTATSDEGIRVSIDGAPLIVNWSPHQETSNTARCTLALGVHKLSVEYFEETAAAMVILSWVDPETAKLTPIPPLNFFHAAADFQSFALAPSPELRMSFPAQPQILHQVSYSPQGKVLASAGDDHLVKLWDPKTGKELRTLKGHAGAVLSAVFSPDGKTLATAGFGGKIKLWDVESQADVGTLAGHAEATFTLAWGAKGGLLASGGYDKLLRLWDPGTGKEIRTASGHAGPLYAVAWKPDGSLIATGSADSTVRLWDMDPAKEPRILLGHVGAVLAVAFSPDGKVLATAGNDRTLKLWETATGKEIRTLTGHGDLIRSLAFRSDGKVLASASRDATIRVWDVLGGRELYSLTGHLGGVQSIAFLPHGNTLASAGLDATIRLWEAK